jgi:cytochrome b pre-mRNA-processing protein 3
MLTRLKMWQDRRRQARSLYDSIVTQARTRSLYADLGVPDTPEGRFEMVTLHLVLVLDRLDRAGEPGRRLARSLTETFAVDLDDNFREMSVGDLAVPKHVKRGVAQLLERYNDYRAALSATDSATAGARLTVAIQSRLTAVGAGQGLDARHICAYIRRGKHRLDQESTAAVLAGRIDWPPVDGAEPDAPSAEPGGQNVGAGLTEGEHAR